MHLHRSAGRHVPRAVMPKYLQEKTQISAMMLKHFCLSSPTRV
jgi:hypothetical protein